MNATKELVEEMMHYASADLNAELGLNAAYDQSKGNRCDRLTRDVCQSLVQRGMSVRRELHMDDFGNWHYVLAHSDETAIPSDTEVISSLNPWQWREYGGGILHLKRAEMLEALNAAGCPDNFVSLHGLETIVKAHDMNPNPFVEI